MSLHSLKTSLTVIHLTSSVGLRINMDNGGRSSFRPQAPSVLLFKGAPSLETPLFSQYSENVFIYADLIKVLRRFCHFGDMFGGLSQMLVTQENVLNKIAALS